jgi:hypothetical protein
LVNKKEGVERSHSWVGTKSVWKNLFGDRDVVMLYITLCFLKIHRLGIVHQDRDKKK